MNQAKPWVLFNVGISPNYGSHSMLKEMKIIYVAFASTREPGSTLTLKSLVAVWIRTFKSFYKINVLQRFDVYKIKKIIEISVHEKYNFFF